MTALADQKAQARAAAFARREQAHKAGQGAEGAALLMQVLAQFHGRILSGYMAMRTEIDPLPAMAAHRGQVCVPVIKARAHPLEFQEWTPDAVLLDGPFGARVPQNGAILEPEVLIVPLVAFDAQGNRLGYGGGFYDRTLQNLRALRPTIAIGFAYAAQQADALPLEATDQPLDFIVTETGILDFRSSATRI
ncbi:5-formyltetrahydrofolate cyclo-ligase [Pseudogemmobacter sp. W21_MBD1_M6]|uniref:5-formyltetrahydrofolate cyclo-ligase n=1 Tax=Pseudogemmobacter sp. W21_MBD1_M6 TaxID=3240271 RepID=UPI003F9C9E58